MVSLQHFYYSKPLVNFLVSLSMNKNNACYHFSLMVKSDFRLPCTLCLSQEDVLSCLEDIRSTELPAYLNSEAERTRKPHLTHKMISDGQSHPERLETQRSVQYHPLPIPQCTADIRLSVHQAILSFFAPRLYCFIACSRRPDTNNGVSSPLDRRRTRCLSFVCRPGEVNV